MRHRLQLGLIAATFPCFKENKVNYLRKLLLGKMYIWEVAAFPSWGSCHLKNCHFGKCTFEKLLLFLYEEVATWEIVSWENVHLGSCCLGNCTFWKLPLGKIPFGSCHLGKGLWEISQMPDHIFKPFLIKRCKSLLSDTVYFLF